MTSNKPYHIKAFTIFEVTLVLAIMSVLIGIIGSITNRFNEQLKNTSDIFSQLNEWRTVRSTIWTDFYNADSIKYNNGELQLFSTNNEVDYKVQEEKLFRNNTGVWLNLNITANSINAEEKKGAFVYNIDFPWGDDIMTLKYHHKPSIDITINDFFNRLE